MGGVTALCISKDPAAAEQAGPQLASLKSAVTAISYENCVPLLVEQELRRRYENIYATLEQLKAYGSLPGNTSTYLAWRGGEVATLLLFVMQDGRARVLNELIAISEAELAGFSRHVFSQYRSIGVISLRAVQLADLSRWDVRPWPLQRANYSEDFVVSLPQTEHDYLAQLDTSARTAVTFCMHRLKAAFPTFRYQILAAESVSDATIRSIVRLKHEQMRGKRKQKMSEQEEAARILELLKNGGLVGIATIENESTRGGDATAGMDQEICSGLICCQVGPNYFVQVLAVHSKYEAYRLGLLCSYGMICECIARGGREYHFLWGREDYKSTLAAVRRDLHHLDIYRSRIQMLRSAGTVLLIACRSWLRSRRLRRMTAARTD